ncbi:MAG: hypothetical protein U1F70_05095 [Candidatus Competibacteraceae bacterium]
MPAAVTCLREPHRLATGNEWVLPARKAQGRMLPHIHENTLKVLLASSSRSMPAAWESARGARNTAAHNIAKSVA